MKILIVRPFSSSGGVGYFYDTIKPHFTCQVRYFYVGQRRKNELMIFRQVRDYLIFVAELATGKYDLVHINPSLRPNAVIRDGIFLLLSKLFRKKIIVFFRGWDDELEIKIKKWFLRLFGAVYFSADAFIVLASRFRSSLLEMGCTKPVFIETTLVPDETFDLTRAKQANNGAHSLNILFLSRIEKYKGVYESVEAYIILKKKYSGISMTLAGDGSELNAIKDYLDEKNVTDVKITGWLDGEDKIKAYQKADIYLFPTYGEGMPNSLLEAMAHGLPVITRPVGGIKDFFIDGEMGFLTDSTESAVLADLCEILIRDTEKRSYISNLNRRYAKENFLASEVCKRLEVIYFDIVNN